MKHVWVVVTVLSLSLLAACTDQQTAAPVASEPAPVAAPVAAEPAPAPAPVVEKSIIDPNPMSTPLPEGFVLKIAHHPRLDASVPSKKGTRSRRTEFEILEGTPASAVESIAASMLEAGFTVHKAPETKGTTIRESFAKKGYGIVNVRVEEKAPKGFQNPAATGFVAIAW